MINAFKGIDQTFHTMATQIGHQSQQFGIAALFKEARDITLIANIVEQAFAEGSTSLEAECRVHLVWTIIDPDAQFLTARLSERLAH